MKFRYNDNCKFFKADMPCLPQKLRRKICTSCDEYLPIKKNILIIKLGAAGDVIRTTPLLRRLKSVYPHCRITWVTYYPEVLPREVDEPLKFDARAIIYLQSCAFDVIYNLDKEKPACGLANLIKAKKKKGFFIKNNKCAPIDNDALDKFLTGIDDGLNRKNRLSYQEEIFNICGLEFKGERYILEARQAPQLSKFLKRPLIGLNTGCGERWETRLWPVYRWQELCAALKKRGYGVMLLGGEKEHDKNLKLAKQAKVYYPGVFTLEGFIGVMNQCDLVVTAVTMALHIAIGLNKKVVLFNNIFNRHEFNLYGQGLILEPKVKCAGCYMQSCAKPCMETITAKQALDSIDALLG